MSLELDKSGNSLRESFFSLQFHTDVARLLDVEHRRLVYHVYRVPLALKYTRFVIPKKSQGYRTILAPSSPLKIIQRKLAQVLKEVYKPKPSAHGFISGRSIVSNASSHTRKRCVLNLDLKDFFPSINYGRVRGMFMGIPYKRPPKVATLLAAICCAENQLPQGAPTSPTVSNMICAKLDSQLQALAQEYKCFYTRYADDITFSTNLLTFPDAIVRVVAEGDARQVAVGGQLRGIIEGNGFEINEAKVRLQERGGRQEVTGLTTNKIPNVRRRLVRQIRAMLYAWWKFGLDKAQAEFLARYDKKHRLPSKESPVFQSVLKGKLSFLLMVKGRLDPVYRNLATRYAELDADFKLAPVGYEAAKRSMLVLEEQGGRFRQGTAFALDGYGFVTCAHVVGETTRAVNPFKPADSYEVRVVKTDEDLDLAIIEIVGYKLTDGEPLKPQPVMPGQMTPVTVVGFPNYQNGDLGFVHRGWVTGFRTVATIRRILTDAAIIAGNSGGPVFNDKMEVVGIAATGADRMDDAKQTEHHSVIPVSVLSML